MGIRLSGKEIFLRIVTTLSQWILAATFLFSGFIKALDPLGMEHKLEAYSAHLHWNIPAGSIYLDTAVLALALVEFSLGVYLLLGMRKRMAAFGTLIFMTFMTLVTIYIYLYSPVPDCGCFGEAITLTNGQTLAKNIVLLALSILLCVAGRHSVRLISEHLQWLLSSYALIYLIGVTLYSLHYLPLIDFAGYDVGTDIAEAMTPKQDMTFIYEKNGRRETFRMDNLPDSTWKYISTETKVIRPATIKDFSFTDVETGAEISDALLMDSTNWVYIVTIPNMSMADAGASDMLNDIYDYARDHHQTFICATAGSQKEISDWIDRTGAAYPFATATAETLEAMVRSNPGLMAIKGGRVAAKWGRNNLPDAAQLDALNKLQIQPAGHRGAVTRLFLWFVLPFGLIVLIDRLLLGRRYLKVYSYYKSHKKQ